MGSLSIPTSAKTLRGDLLWFPISMGINACLQKVDIMEKKSQSKLPEWVLLLQKAIEENKQYKGEENGTEDRLENA